VSEKPEGVVPASVLAQLFDCDEKTVRNLANRGIVVKAARGQFVASQSIRNYVRHLRSTASGRGGEEEQLVLTQQRARFAKEQADSVSLKNAVLRGQLVSAREVESRWAGVFSAIRARMIGIVSDAVQALPHLTRHDSETLDRLVRDALNEAADEAGAVSEPENFEKNENE
jgi:terminase small subunit / prophage DNA-packing protein